MTLRQQLVLYCDRHKIKLGDVLPVIKMCLDEVKSRDEATEDPISFAKDVWEEIKNAS